MARNSTTFKKGHPFYGDKSKLNISGLKTKTKMFQLHYCEGCKEPYETKRTKQIYCSRECQLDSNGGRFKKEHSFLKGGEKGWFKIGNKNRLGKHLTFEQNKRRLEGWLKSIHMSPNKLETYVINLINQANLPYKFVGDGQFILANKCPDFVNVNGQKKVIEVAGTYWHTEEEMEERKKLFAKFGFRTLILWENEVKKMKDEEIKEKIRVFDNSPRSR